MTTVSSCMMIELVMYGMMPSEKTANRVSAPPENRSMNCSAPWLPRLFLRSDNALRSMFGTGTWEPSRKTAMIPMVNRIFLRRSGILKALTNAFSMRISPRDGRGPGESPVYRVSMISTDPPAPSILARAELDTAFARTTRARSRSPRPRTLTGIPLRTRP